LVGSGFYNDAAPDGALLAPADAKTDGQIIFTGSEFNAANRIGRQISRQVMLGSRSIMASIDFYALKEDIRVLIHAIFVESDIRIFESYSRYDEELREFRSFDELAAAFSLGSDPHGNGHAVLLQLWSSSVMPKVEFERITLKVAGHSFRYRISGVGLIQLYFGGEHEGIITDSHYGH
jgi:hypothetical protein